MQCLSAPAAGQLAAAQARCFTGAAKVAAPACPRVSSAGGALNVVAMAGKKKVIKNLDDWQKEFVGYGIFVEDSETKPVNIAKTLEEKKLLSSVEKSGLLSALEGAGFTLSKIEQLKLLSTAEKLGLLSLLEDAAVKGPGFFASLSFPLLVGAIVVPIIIPDDNLALDIAQYGLAAGLGLAAVTAFGTSIALRLLLD